MSNLENDRIAETKRDKATEQWADYAWLIPEVIAGLRSIEARYLEAHSMVQTRQAAHHARKVSSELLTMILTNVS